MTVRRRVLVSGRVQGVFYRATCHDRAVLEGVAGWVRNLPDGRVEAAFEGTLDAVDAMVDWCRRGPDRAQVTGVEVLDEPPEGAGSFEVR